MRIVVADNFGMSGETPGKDERFVGESWKRETCEILVSVLNNLESGRDHPDYYKAVSDDYRLRTFEP